MKRIFMLALITVLLICTLSACIMIPRRKNFEIDPETVASVEFYDLREYKGPEESAFLKTEVPVYTLPTGSTAAFLSDLGDIRFSDTIIITIAAIDPSFRYGEWVVRINYTDGSFQLLSDGGYGESFDANGERTSSHHFSPKDERWSALMEKYLPQSVFEE